MLEQVVSMAVVLFLVTDPLGNLPVFIAALESSPAERYKPIVIRESCIALAVLIGSMLCGGQLLNFMGLSPASLELAGGAVLFLIAIKMVFGGGPGSHRHDAEPRVAGEEPFVVPLAIPLVAGPGALSTCIVVGAQGALPIPLALLALVAAWLAGTLILLSGRWLMRIAGHKVMQAMESLMGLLLVAMSAEMAIKGIKQAFNLS